jgi:hypothetical protein
VGTFPLTTFWDAGGVSSESPQPNNPLPTQKQHKTTRHHGRNRTIEHYFLFRDADFSLDGIDELSMNL